MVPSSNKRLFFFGCVALTATSLTFTLRANMIEPLGKEFQISNEQIGYVVGTAFWGFAISVLFGSVLLQKVSGRSLMLLAALCHAIGITSTVFANGFLSLFISTLLVGLGNGLVEAVCNPLVVALFPDKRIQMLNRFHLWFPGGIVIGGLLAFMLNKQGIAARDQGWLIMLPVAIYGIGFFSSTVPNLKTLVSSGATKAKSALSGILQPFFFLMVTAMFLSATTELGTNQWISRLLGDANLSPLLVLVLINGVMVVGRYGAGTLLHQISGFQVLVISAILSAVGMFALSLSAGPALVISSAVIFAMGVCFFWPTMLGYMSETSPETGQLGLGIMGAGGMAFVGVVSPFIGKLYDKNLATAQGVSDLGSEAAAGRLTLQQLSILPIILLTLLIAAKVNAPIHKVELTNA